MEPIVLTGKKELDIYVNPQRQNILRQMQIAGTPMTAKQIADLVGISASSVQHHIRLLCELGIVEQSHTEQIHGITATYFRVLPRTVRIGSFVADECGNQRVAIMQSSLNSIFTNFLRYCAKTGEPRPGEPQFGDMLSGISHLRDDEASELYALICDFLQAHETVAEHTTAWEYALIAYPVEASRNA
jgi:DNA-binding transcriptional regulator GbsR (MarR family)